MKKTAGRIRKRILTIGLCMVLLPILGAISVDAADGKNDDPGRFRLQGETDDAFYEDETVSAAAVDASANPYTGVKYTHNAAFDNMQIINGIDVSGYQNNIDWSKAKNAGIDFAMVRVGYRGYGSAGNFGADAFYDRNMQGAINAGMKVGVYIFSQAITTQEAEEEAQYILDRIGNYPISMPLVLDYEYAATGVGRLYNAKLSKDAATQICIAFCNKIRAAGYTPMVYANPTMLTNQLDAEKLSTVCPIWLANYTSKTNYQGNYSFWQYSSKGSVDGILGPVDMNFWYTNDVNVFSAKTLSISRIPDMLYTGQPVVPEFQVTCDGVTLQEGTDYTYTISGNTEVGTATITVTGMNQYSDKTQTAQFRIVNPTVSDFTVAGCTKTTATVNWTAIPGVSGYEIYRSTVWNGKYKKVKTITSGETGSWKQTGLTAGKEYYYKIRTVINTEGTAKYGEYSGSVTARTGKAYTRKLLAQKRYVIRTAPVNGNVVCTVSKKALLTVVANTTAGNGSQWYYVSYRAGGKTYNGYIAKSCGTLYRYGKVKAKSLNVRRAAGVKKALVTVVKKNKKLTITGSKKAAGAQWYRVSFKKGKYYYTGYVKASNVKLY